MTFHWWWCMILMGPSGTEHWGMILGGWRNLRSSRLPEVHFEHRISTIFHKLSMDSCGFLGQLTLDSSPNGPGPSLPQRFRKPRLARGLWWICAICCSSPGTLGIRDFGLPEIFYGKATGKEMGSNFWEGLWGWRPVISGSLLVWQAYFENTIPRRTSWN